MHDPFQVTGTSSMSQAQQEHIPAEMEKQHVHEGWWMISLFAAVVPFGAAFGFLLQPLAQFMKEDSQWSPPLSDEDMWLMDGAVLAPCVIIPTLVGMAMDSAWSINYGLLICLIGSVVGQFCVAMGIAWHSFGMLLVGRLIWGCFVGGVVVVADTIAAQFNKRRRATTFGLITAAQVIGLGMNGSWMPNFTQESLGSDYEKANDVMLIVSLICLGIGFMWTPIVNSCELTDEPKRRYWKWHMHAGIWALAITNLLLMLRSAAPHESEQAFWWAMTSVVILGPLLGYFLDKGDKSQAGSNSPMNFLITATILMIVANIWERMNGNPTGMSNMLGSVGIGLVPMLIRSVVPQVASRDNLGTSFGVLEGSTFLGMILSSTMQLSVKTELVLLAVALVMFIYMGHVVKDKWEREAQTERGHGALNEPLFRRGG